MHKIIQIDVWHDPCEICKKRDILIEKQESEIVTYINTTNWCIQDVCT